MKKNCWSLSFNNLENEFYGDGDKITLRKGKEIEMNINQGGRKREGQHLTGKETIVISDGEVKLREGGM